MCPNAKYSAILQNSSTLMDATPTDGSLPTMNPGHLSAKWVISGRDSTVKEQSFVNVSQDHLLVLEFELQFSSFVVKGSRNPNYDILTNTFLQVGRNSDKEQIKLRRI